LHLAGVEVGISVWGGNKKNAYTLTAYNKNLHSHSFNKKFSGTIERIHSQNNQTTAWVCVLKQRRIQRKMMFRRKSSTSNANSNALDSVNSAGAKAMKCSSEKKIRTPSYCEENVWRLAYRRLKGSAADTGVTSSGKENEEYYVVFISNDGRLVPT
jgi:hypothetical protein